jgi:xanthine/uracil permease
MLRLVLGVLKGAAVGAGVGLGAAKIGFGDGVLAFAVYGLVGALVGIVCGKALWRQETLFTPLLKGIFGFAIGVGLYYGVRKLFGSAHFPLATGFGAPDRPFVEIPFLVGPLIGMIYGAFVEVDDSGSGKSAAVSKTTAPKP